MALAQLSETARQLNQLYDHLYEYLDLDDELNNSIFVFMSIQNLARCAMQLSKPKSDWDAFNAQDKFHLMTYEEWLTDQKCANYRDDPEFGHWAYSNYHGYTQVRWRDSKDKRFSEWCQKRREAQENQKRLYQEA